MLITKNVEVTVDIESARLALYCAGFYDVGKKTDNEVFDMVFNNMSCYGVKMHKVPETNDKFEDVLEEASKSATLSEVEEYGFPMFGEDYVNENGQKIKIQVYELKGKTFVIRYVDGECIEFRDITASK